MARLCGGMLSLVGTAAWLVLAVGGVARGDTIAAGLGTTMCSDFTQMHRVIDAKGADNRFYSWAQGYMSGLNAVDEKATGIGRDLSSVPVAEQQRYLREFCERYPTTIYLIGVRELWQTLHIARWRGAQ